MLGEGENAPLYNDVAFINNVSLKTTRLIQNIAFGQWVCH